MPLTSWHLVCVVDEHAGRNWRGQQQGGEVSQPDFLQRPASYDGVQSHQREQHDRDLAAFCFAPSLPQVRDGRNHYSDRHQEPHDLSESLQVRAGREVHSEDGSGVTVVLGLRPRQAE